MNEELIYPYLPTGRTIRYVPADNSFMMLAKDCARQHSLDTTMPTAAVVVKGTEVLGMGANGSDYHQLHGCERVRQHIPTGERYELCEGCHPKNHGERKAILHVRENGHKLLGADLYLWGHWWCCEPCWNAMIEAGINQVFLMEGSEVLFNKENPGNVIGRQFAK